ncbi:MAG: endonuclease MutS2 [Treponema sp.]|nr:endonuclease MutS2 [Treponema sp.]
MSISEGNPGEKALRLLQFDAIRERVAACSMSGETADLLRAEVPAWEAEKAAATQNAVRAVISRIRQGKEDPRKYLPPIGSLIRKLGVENVSLEIEEVFALALFTERGEEIRAWLAPHPDLDRYFASLPDCSNIAASVFRVVDRDGNIRDLPELRAIKQRIRNLRSGLDALVARYSGSEEARRMLQSPLPSQRDGRIVLAVKANFRGRIPGIVHEASSSGQTIFVEPQEVVEKNNDIFLETKRLEIETKKILADLTRTIAASARDLKIFHETVLDVEAVVAKARYSLETGGNFCGTGTPAGVRLVRARHPLLENCVPIDLAMTKNHGDSGGTGNAIRALIVTGPNTGGKTVSLKTVGLFAMMNQIGLALPVDEGSSLPVFDGIFADIGDEQSIGQSLSTFSAHITGIASILERCTESSLVLLDELGSGTDPEEGSAIAMAIMDHLIEKNATVIITTHHGVLKHYGYTRPLVENASVEFNKRTLSPTYRIVAGIPGESRALEIAARNGLVNDIVTKARQYVDRGHSDISELIAGLKEKHRKLDLRNEAAKTDRARLEERERMADLRELELKRKELELNEGFSGRLGNLLDESRKTLENLVRELREGEIDREKTLKVKEFLGELERNARAEKALLDAQKQELARESRKEKVRTKPREALPLAVGMEVLAGEPGRRGTLLRRGKKSGGEDTWLVGIGALRISFPESLIAPAKPSAKPKPQIAGVDYARPPQASLEIDLRGMRLEQALEALRRQTDAAVLCGLRTFSVIHGTGDGILQKGVHDRLKTERAVADYFFSHPELGGFGRTEVVLR